LRKNSGGKLTKVCWNLFCSTYLYSEGGFEMDKYVCELCDYTYDPAVGDPENNVAAGTSFEKLPAEWVCPICGAEKFEFQVAK
jgi:rubredoxin